MVKVSNLGLKMGHSIYPDSNTWSKMSVPLISVSCHTLKESSEVYITGSFIRLSIYQIPVHLSNIIDVT